MGFSTRSFAALAIAVPLFATPAFAADFRLSSPSLTDGGKIAERHVFSGFGCNGGNQAPALAWENPPAGTRSFAVTMYDPDAPTGSGWWHWVVFNLPASAKGLAAAADLPPNAVASRTDFGAPGYGGPCPPQGHGPHRYIFTVHALKLDALPLDANAPGAMVGFFLNDNSLATASMTVLYER